MDQPKHGYGDTVEVTVGGAKVLAFVIQSNFERETDHDKQKLNFFVLGPDGKPVEHLQVVYLDPKLKATQLSSQDVDKAIVKAFLGPLYEGKTYGFTDAEPAAAPAADPDREKLVEALQKGNDTAAAELVKVSGELQKANDANQALQDQVEHLKGEIALLPTEDDLVKLTGQLKLYKSENDQLHTEVASLKANPPASTSATSSAPSGETPGSTDGHTTKEGVSTSPASEPATSL